MLLKYFKYLKQWQIILIYLFLTALIISVGAWVEGFNEFTQRIFNAPFKTVIIYTTLSIVITIVAIRHYKIYHPKGIENNTIESKKNHPK